MKKIHKNFTLILLLCAICSNLLLSCRKSEGEKKAFKNNTDRAMVAILADTSDIMLEHLCYEMLKINIQMEAEGAPPFCIFVPIKDRAKAIQALKSDKWLVGKKIKVCE